MNTIVTIVLLHNDNLYQSKVEMGQEVSFGSHKKDSVYVADFTSEQIRIKWKTFGFSVNAKKAYDFEKDEVPLDTILVLNRETKTVLYLSSLSSRSQRSIKLPYNCTLKIGRKETNDVVIKLPFVSGNHFVLKNESGNVRVEDNGSTNGLYLNIYSLSVVLYRLMNDNCLPFIDKNNRLNPVARKEALEKRLKGEQFDAPCNASSEFAKVIMKACAFNPEDRFKDIEEFKNAICDFAEENKIKSTGTTEAMLLFQEKEVTLSNVGDSRIYKFSRGELKQISFDHVSISIMGRKPPLSQNLGIPESDMVIQPYIVSEKLKDGDRYLISSDGLTDMVSENEIKCILSEKPDAKAACKALVDTALNNGGKDNVTVIIINVYREKWSLFHINP